MPDWLEEILSQPTASIQDTARVLNMGRNQAYEAAQRGEIPALQFGRSKRVPTAWIKRALQLEENGDAP